MKKAKELKVGDKIKCGDIVVIVELVRKVIESHEIGHGVINNPTPVHYITVTGQPEIADWNLQKFFDQGGFEIITEEAI